MTYSSGKWSMPAVSAAAVRDKAGVVDVALANLDPNRPAQVTVALDGVAAGGVTGQVLTAPAMNALNSFDRPDMVVPASFTDATVAGGKLTATLPPKSVVVLELR